MQLDFHDLFLLIRKFQVNTKVMEKNFNDTYHVIHCRFPAEVQNQYLIPNEQIGPLILPLLLCFLSCSYFLLHQFVSGFPCLHHTWMDHECSLLPIRCSAGDTGMRSPPIPEEEPHQATLHILSAPFFRANFIVCMDSPLNKAVRSWVVGRSLYVSDTILCEEIFKLLAGENNSIVGDKGYR